MQVAGAEVTETKNLKPGAKVPCLGKPMQEL
jgi:hypothetical protein